MTHIVDLHKRWPWAALVVGLGLGCCGLTSIAMRLSPATTIPAMAGTRVCLGTATTPYFQMGLGWELPRQTMILSSLGPPILYSPSSVCAHLPWEIPFIPIRGAWVLPP